MEARPPVYVSVHCFTIYEFESQKIAQASLIPGVHNHKHTIANVGAITSRLIITKLLDRNAILADDIEQTVKKSGGTVLWGQRRAPLE